MAGTATTRIYELQVKLAAESLRNLKSIENSAKNANAKLDLLSEGFKGLAQGLAAGFTVDAFVEGIKNAIEQVDELGAAAQRIGIGVDTFSALKFAAEQSDVSVQALESGMIKLEKAMSDVSSEGGKVLKALRIDPNQDPTKVLEDFATALEGIRDPAQQTGALLAVFGRNGAELKPLLQQGGEGIKKLVDEAERLGLVVGPDAANAISDLDNNLKKIKASSQAAMIQLAEGLTPALTDLTQEFIDAGNQGDAFRKVGEGIGTVLRGVANSVSIAASGMRILGISVAEVVADLKAIGSGNTFAQWANNAKVSTASLDEEVANLLKTIERNSVVQTKAAEPKKEDVALTKAQIDAAARLRDVLNKTNDDKKAAAEAERAWNKEKALAATLNEKGLTDLERYNEAEGEANRLRAEGLLTLAGYNQAIIDAEDAYEKARIAREQLTGAEKEGAELTKAMRTPLEVFNDSIAQYNYLLEQGAISQETFNRAVIDSAQKWQTANDAANKGKENLQGTDALLDDLANNLPKYGESISGTLIDFATNADSAKASFSDMALSILRDIAKMATQILVVQPLMEALKKSIQSTAAAGGGGFGGFFSSLFGSANGNAFSGGAPLAFANGGVVSSPILFPMRGGRTGMAGEAGPEAILPLQRDSAGRLGVSGGNQGVTVNVINNAGAQVSVEQQTGPTGDQVIQVMVERAVETAIGRGKFDNTFQQVYGINRRGR